MVAAIGVRVKVARNPNIDTTLMLQWDQVNRRVVDDTRHQKNKNRPAIISTHPGVEN